MALNTQEKEFLNQIDKNLAANINQFNEMIDDKRIQSLLDISQNLQTMQNNLLYYQVFSFVVIALAVWYCYQILTGKFVEHLYQSISTKIIKNFDEAIDRQEKRFEKLETMLKYNYELVHQTQSFLSQQNQLASSALRSISEYEKKLFSFANENERLHSELIKAQNILRKKIKKGV